MACSSPGAYGSTQGSLRYSGEAADGLGDQKVDLSGLAVCDILLKTKVSFSIIQRHKKTAQLEVEYEDVLSKLSVYEEWLGSKIAVVNDVLKHQGLIEIRDSITSDWMTAKQAIEEKAASEKELKKKIRLYNDRKK